MTNSVVIELQREALNRNVQVSDLLRKALIVARKLRISEFEKWITHELNGYIDNSDKPEYREIKGEIRGWNPYHGWQPIHFENAKVANGLSKRTCIQSVAEIETLVENRSDSGSYHMPFSHETQNEICDLIDFTTQITVMVPYTALVRILDAVRNIVLNWAMKLEEDGILGEGMSFTAQEKEKAKGTSEINIQNFQGILGDVSGSTVNQNLNMGVRQGDFESLEEFLKAKGLKGDDIAALKNAVDADPRPTEPDRFGKRVSDWTGRMLAKAASGGWQISLSAAGGLLTKALSSYYGF